MDRNDGPDVGRIRRMAMVLGAVLVVLIAVGVCLGWRT